MNSIDIRHGDCLEVLRSLEDNSVDSVITDPPYGLSNTKPAQVADVLTAWVTGDTEAVPAKKGGFMGADWDSFVPPPAVWAECLRVLKPGGHMAVFAGARTQDLMGLSVRLAGFEIRDTLGWIYGSGFPKSHDIGKAIDKRRDERHEEALQVTKVIAGRAKELGVSRRDINLKINGADNSGGSAQSWTTISSAGAHKPRVPEWDQWVRLRELLNLSDPVLDAEVWRLNGRKGTPGEAWEKREVISERPAFGIGGNGILNGHSDGATAVVSAPHSDVAKQWDGWGTALKPAIEPIILARKPLDGTVAANVLAHGVGGLNIDASRVPGAKPDTTRGASVNASSMAGPLGGQGRIIDDGKGRFPANVLLDEHAAAEMDEQSGVSTSVQRVGDRSGKSKEIMGEFSGQSDVVMGHTDSGGASRFFPVFKYQAKAPKKERPVIVREDGTKVQHPTVKPLALLDWLVTLITPEGGTTLDPFAGTGTTLQAARDKGFNAIGVEQDEDYIELIEQRLGRRGVKAIVTGDAEYVARSFDDLRPGAHVAVRASPTQLPDSGLALRLAGFEIRDTIAHIVGDRIVWWILARKPLVGTVAANVLAHGVGGLNIDASRVGSDGGTAAINFGETRGEMYGGGKGKPTNEIGKIGKWRFPANVLLDEHAAKEMDEQSGVLKTGSHMAHHKRSTTGGNGLTHGDMRGVTGPLNEANEGGASRFFPLLDEDEAENWIRRLIDPDQSA